MTNLKNRFFSRKSLASDREYKVTPEEIRSNSGTIFFVDHPDKLEHVFVIGSAESFLPDFMRRTLRLKRLSGNATMIAKITKDQTIIAIYITAKTKKFGENRDASDSIIVSTAGGNPVVTNCIATINVRCDFDRESAYTVGLCLDDYMQPLHISCITGVGGEQKTVFPAKVAKYETGAYKIKFSLGAMACLDQWLRSPSKSLMSKL